MCDKDAPKAVYGQPGELVGLAENDPAGGQVGRLENSFAVRPGVLDPPPPKSGVKGIVGVAGKHPYADLAVQGDKPCAEIGALGADDVGK